MIIFYKAVTLTWENKVQEQEWNSLIKEIEAKRIMITVKPHMKACSVTLCFADNLFHRFSITKNGRWRERLLKNLRAYRAPFLKVAESEKVAWRLE